jgi:undecaprenyl-diphosphatase
MSELLQLDQQLFELINGSGHTAWLDAIMPWWREKTSWIPLYVLLAGYLVWRYRLRAVYYLIAVGLLIALADTLSSQVVKPLVERPRPCNDPALKDEVQLLVSCGVGYSFTSSHATNHFALANFFSLTLPFFAGWRGLFLFLWAGSIAYGQVYVGVHYPLDVLAGALLGTACAIPVAGLYRRLPAAYQL